MATIQEARGSVSLIGEAIDILATSAIPDLKRKVRDFQIQTTPFHITLVTKDEKRNLSPAALASLVKFTAASASEIGIFHHLGTACIKRGGSDVAFIVVIWVSGQQIRKRLGLPHKDFHITLSANDNHNIDKSIACLRVGEFDVQNASLECLDHLTFTLHNAGRYLDAKAYSQEILLRDPESSKGWLRLADAALQLGEFKVSMLAYAQAWKASENDKMSAYTVKMLHKCSTDTEWGHLLQEEELTQLESVSKQIRQRLLTPWPNNLRESIADMGVPPSLCLEPRRHLSIPDSIGVFSLPRFFRWLVPFKIAVMSTPRNGRDIRALSSDGIGIKTVLTLTEEEPLDQSWFNTRIKNVFLPIRNYYPPSIEQMDIAMRILTDEESLPVLIHCGGGKGRAGSIAACYMAACGFTKPNLQSDDWQPAMSAQDSISKLRAIRPGSIETEQQEVFISKWVSVLWKRQSLFPTAVPEPPACPLDITGQLDGSVDFLMLVGIPGSGKSWVAKSLLARDPRWTYVSQDESSRSACETAVSRTKGKLILDRCNTSAADRKFWLQLADAKNAVCVLFDYDTELCVSRAQQRADHPTLPPGSRVLNAVKQMTEQFSAPEFKEGFKAVLTVKSFAASDDLISQLSPTIGLLKFPRTAHLIDLGAIGSDDILLPSAPALSPGCTVVITEKVDGANMGFSLSSDRQLLVQNRSHFVNSSSHSQFKKLDSWMARHREELFGLLNQDKYFPQRYILYGEWMHAVHSVSYNSLPDRFLAFDLFDRGEGKFVNRETLETLLSGTEIHITRVMEKRDTIPTDIELRALVQRQSAFAEGRVEGVVVKIEDKNWVKWRGKVVRGDFLAGNQHWSKNIMQENGILVTNMEELDIAS
ncbi:hypothetical protein VE01_10288 [Pseudogymnoascus verrucosus]|uniref:Tyrosine specific protein phosphatases domain-containing protein n=1 Tax=Pseudogymnoascus verrucosus TaxID=342668 RepID=A0A1B8G876_9PEZI|nr:uncharacterized protein VE01_10288 [Pseudogymnoascus verrucosus]OBT92021.1 hypothetical protein VE01_10288 [Pseudogymnoascus verrucosus]